MTEEKEVLIKENKTLTEEKESLVKEKKKWKQQAQRLEITAQKGEALRRRQTWLSRLFMRKR
ncbi:MAG: hypothetical protein ACLU9N_12220 [Clostridia bacterium]